MIYDEKVIEMRVAEVEALRKFYQDTLPLLEKLNHKLIVADIALRALAKNGNTLAQQTLADMDQWSATNE